MGPGGIGIWQLVIVLAIVMVLFGTKRLRTIGGDLGSALRGFRNSMRDSEGDGGSSAVERQELEERAETPEAVEVRAESPDRQVT